MSMGSAYRILALIGMTLVARANVISSGGFGINGDVGFANSPPGLSITFGLAGQGSIYQMDGFVNAPGVDWGDGSGVSHQLTNGSPPQPGSGLGYTFNASQPTAHQLLLTYRFVNNTGQSIPGFEFLYFADPDIGSNFADEWATVTGSPGFGLTSYQVGDPGSSTIFTNLINGTLSNTNEQPVTSPGDVSTALAFKLSSLGIGGNATFQVLMSDDLSSIGSLIVTQHDPIYTNDTLTLSGQIVVPEPSSLVLFGAGLVALALAIRYRKRHAV